MKQTKQMKQPSRKDPRLLRPERYTASQWHNALCQCESGLSKRGSFEGGRFICFVYFILLVLDRKGPFLKNPGNGSALC